MNSPIKLHIFPQKNFYRRSEAAHFLLNDKGLFDKLNEIITKLQVTTRNALESADASEPPRCHVT